MDSGQGGDASNSAHSARELAALAKRVHDSGGPLELVSADAGTPREVVDGGGALPPVDASTDAGELVDAGRDAGQRDAGELVDASHCPFRCGGACSVWPCP